MVTPIVDHPSYSASLSARLMVPLSTEEPLDADDDDERPLLRGAASAASGSPGGRAVGVPDDSTGENDTSRQQPSGPVTADELMQQRYDEMAELTIEEQAEVCSSCPSLCLCLSLSLSMSLCLYLSVLFSLSGWLPPSLAICHGVCVCRASRGSVLLR
jgi:hypothetical protein